MMREGKDCLAKKKEIVRKSIMSNQFSIEEKRNLQNLCTEVLQDVQVKVKAQFFDQLQI